MPYTKTNWVAGVTPLSEANMDNLEIQYEEAMSDKVFTELWSAVYEVTSNNTWENWDISGIVPEGTTGVAVLITGDNLTATPIVGVRADGSVLVRSFSITRDGGNTGRHTMFAPVGATRIIECYESVITSGVIQFRIMGYWL